MSRVTAVVVNWNGWKETLACLGALDRIADQLSVIVIDNGSLDGSEGRLRRERPDVQLLQTGGNLGYAGGNNFGIRQALEDGAEYVWILNNDALPRPDALRGLLDAMGTGPRVGIVASSVQPPHLATAINEGQLLWCQGCTKRFHEGDTVMGASLFFRTELFREVGVFDERYFHYFEEQDISRRARLAGWRLGLACGSTVDHHPGHALPIWSPQASYYMIRNMLMIERRFHNGQVLGVLIKNRSLLRSHLALRRSLGDRDTRRVIAVAQAVLDAARERTGKRDLGVTYQRESPLKSPCCGARWMNGSGFTAHCRKCGQEWDITKGIAAS